ncbi:MAG: stalk domain-containing protein [Bacillota bacterium]|nr:stalk domain-containing protein [Bacillota bacterium]
MKKIIIGLIIGCIISFSIVYAENMIKVQKASFTIWVDGNQFKTNKPILTVDNTAYVPVREFTSYLNAKTTWNSQSNRIEIIDVPYFGVNSVLTDNFKIQMNGSRSLHRLEENKYLVHFSFQFENVDSKPIDIDYSKDFKLRDSQDKILNSVSNEKQTIEPGQTKLITLEFEVNNEDLRVKINFIYKPSIREYSIPIFLGVDSAP